MPLTYSVYDSVHDGYRVLELRDDGRKQRARIVPAVGATCTDYSVTHHGQTEHLLDPPPDMMTLAQRPTAYGTPILFPFPHYRLKLKILRVLFYTLIKEQKNKN